MDFRVGTVITSLLLGTVQPDPSTHACTSFTDLAEPCGCILSQETFEPTCGSDGHTYLSVCFLECRKTIDKVDISIDYIGVCTKESSRCTCHAGYAPMCATNGITYSNECVFNCFMKKDDRIRLKHNGECGSVVEQRLSVNIQAKPGACHCRSKLRSYDTRFDANGRMYARCGCRPKEKKIQYAQAVQTEQPTTPASEPVNRLSCSNQINNANSRSNEEGLKKVNVDDSKKCLCAAMHKPVCGNNHKTYANYCVLHCSSKRDPGVQFQHWGDCSI